MPTHTRAQKHPPSTLGTPSQGHSLTEDMQRCGLGAACALGILDLAGIGARVSPCSHRE